MNCRDQLRIVCRVAILTFFALFADRVLAQSAGLTEVTLPKEIQGEWRAASATKSLEGREWALTAPTGDGEILAEYGLTSVVTRSYRRSKRQVTARVMIFRQTAGAYGWWSFIRRRGASGQSFGHQGPFVVMAESAGKGQPDGPDERLSGDVKPEDPELTGLTANLLQSLPPGDGQLPILPAHLPGTEAGLIHGSEIYLVGPRSLSEDPVFAGRTRVIDFSGLPDLVTADYRQGGSVVHLLLVEFHTPQAASESLRLWEEDLRQQPVTGPGHTVRRIGNYIVEIAGSSDKSAIDALFGKIRYEQKIYWAGKKASDIPLEFRPLNPAVIREATRTGTIIVQSLIWIGMMMVVVFGAGLLVGGGYFYWRRFREHRKGTDKLFSDGGGSIVLNLQDKD